jgi:DNA polymerase-3 subunit delta
MAVLKPAALEQHLRSKAMAPAYLVFGPDPGKVSEVARTLVSKIAGSLDDPFAVARLEDDQIADDPQRLGDEVFSRPMLGARKAVWVTAAGSAFARAFEQIGELPPDGNIIVAEGANLPKSAKLRVVFESSPFAQAVACYEDTLEDLDRLIDDSFATARLDLSPEAKGALLVHLGENRALSRSEIDKLILYCLGGDRVTLTDVEAVGSGRTAAELNELNDAVFGGDLALAATLASLQLKSGVPGSRLLAVAALHVPFLQKLVLEVEAGSSPAHVVKLARPPVFFNRHERTVQQLKIWDFEALASAARSLAQAIRQTRELPALEDQIAERSLLSLARLAAGRRGVGNQYTD